jgi:hypothetical protein
MKPVPVTQLLLLLLLLAFQACIHAGEQEWINLNDAAKLLYQGGNMSGQQTC